MSILTYRRSRLKTPKIREAEAHVWCFSLSSSLDQLAELEDTLSEAERRRAARFRFERDGKRFALSRGMLRALLANYLGCSAADVNLASGRYGKPFLPNTDFQFNLSHTADVVVYGFTHGIPLGVDIEQKRKMGDMVAVAGHCLAERQLAQFLNLDSQEQVEAFYRFWTRKEALIKATGRGLSQPLRDFDVTFLAHERPRLTRAASGFGDVQHWQLRDVPVPAPYHGSVAVRDPQFEIRFIGPTDCALSISELEGRSD